MAMKRVNFIVKIDNWHHITKLAKLLKKYLKICFHPFCANAMVNLYQVWEHFYFEPGLFVCLFFFFIFIYLFILSVTHVALDTSITDYNLYIITQLIIYGHLPNII